MSNNRGVKEVTTPVFVWVCPKCKTLVASSYKLGKGQQQYQYGDKKDVSKKAVYVRPEGVYFTDGMDWYKHDFVKPAHVTCTQSGCEETYKTIG